MGQRAALEVVASGPSRVAHRPNRATFPEAVRQLPRAVSLVTFRRDADWLGITATSVSSLSVEPPTILVSFDRAAGMSPVVATKASFGVSILAAGQAELADKFGRGSVVETAPEHSGDCWVAVPSGVVLRTDAIAALECESEEIIERHGRAIVIGRVLNVFKIGGSGALVYWRGGFDSIGWTDDEVRRAVGLFPIRG
jgi:flavin reductase (DIM6/NTAB) family NADH-FMN oxidoreductase RutF